ncbi:hypothetical protein ACFWIA_24410 [Streptomyces sp. NPDC127068]|uniref:hypothetical protein n=1 Tax=Streptomyces sp. NPDC127068 TaxID=3347127 RepID=UPI00364EB01F
MRQRTGPTARGVVSALVWGVLLLLVTAFPSVAAGSALVSPPPTCGPVALVPGVDRAPGSTDPVGGDTGPQPSARSGPVPRPAEPSSGPAAFRAEPLSGPVTAVQLTVAGEHSGRPALHPPAPAGPVTAVHAVPAPRGTVVAAWRERGPPEPPSGPRSTRAPPVFRSS